MKTVFVSYNQMNPCFSIKGEIILYDNDIPLVGDIIDIPPFCIKQVSLNLKNRDIIKQFGIECVVIKRKLIIHQMANPKVQYNLFNKGDHWQLELKPIYKLRDK